MFFICSCFREIVKVNCSLCNSTLIFLRPKELEIISVCLKFPIRFANGNSVHIYTRGARCGVLIHTAQKLYSLSVHQVCRGNKTLTADSHQQLRASSYRLGFNTSKKLHVNDRGKNYRWGKTRDGLLIDGWPEGEIWSRSQRKRIGS